MERGRRFAVRWKRSSVEQVVAILKQAETELPGGGFDPLDEDLGAHLLSLEEVEPSDKQTLDQVQGSACYLSKGAGWSRECSQRKYARESMGVEHLEEREAA